jgi:hypothetical protein
MLPARSATTMDVNYYDALLPVREPGAGLPGVIAGIRRPYRVLASVGVPAGRIILAFISDSARLSRVRMRRDSILIRQIRALVYRMLSGIHITEFGPIPDDHLGD